MRMLRTIGPALIALVLLMTVAPAVAAQDDDIFGDLDGIQKAYGRTFAAEGSGGASVPGTDVATEEASTGWMNLTAFVLEFDSEDNAKAASEKAIEASRAETEDEGIELEDVELDLDVDHVAKRATIDEDGFKSSVIQVFAQKDNYLYLVIGMTGGDDPVEVVTSVLDTMVNTDAADDDETFQEDGTSTGGLWAKLPVAEDITSQLEGLTMVYDEVLYPTEGTPAA